MNSLLRATLIGFFAGVTALATQAQEFRIGFVNTDRIFREANTAKQAQAKLEQVSEYRNTRQVSLNAQGKIEELELSIRYTFRLVTAKDQIIIPETTLSAVRNMPFDDRVVQAKEGEAATLFKDMQRSLVTRIIRRITAPDVKTRWDAVAAERGEDDEPIEIAKPVRTPGVIPSPWQNPSLTPSPIPINPD